MTSKPPRRWQLIAAAAALVAAAVLVWRASPLADLLTPEALAGHAAALRVAWWGPFAVVAVYVAAGAIEFPIVLLIGTTALLFPPLEAVPLSFAGALASAAAWYGVGAKLVRGRTREALAGALGKAERALERRGLIAMVLVRSVPVAPFTVVNLACGALGVRLRDYLAGTALGLAPGILAFTAFGHELRAMLRDPSAANAAKLAAIAGGWLLVIVILQKVLQPGARESDRR